MLNKNHKLKKYPLYGLVLAGGKSQRMGQDKGRINWHGKEQRYYLADLLITFCQKVYISCRVDQQNDITNSYKTISDTYENLGQYGALLTAMAKYPNRGWLVVACDLPLINTTDLDYLIDQRDPNRLATAYLDPTNNLPEPLAAIWEPKSQTRLLELLQEGIDCPRKALIKSSTQVKLIVPLFAEATMNANTPADEKEARALIQERRRLNQ